MSKEERLRAFLRGLVSPYREHRLTMPLDVTYIEAQAHLSQRTPTQTPVAAPIQADADTVWRPQQRRGGGQAGRGGDSDRPGRRCFYCHKPYEGRNHKCSSCHPFSNCSLGVVGSTGLLFLRGEIGGSKVTFLVDSGASHNFISSRLAPRNVRGSGSVSLADGSKKPVCGPVELLFEVQDRSMKAVFLVTELKFEAILGLPWLAQVQASATIDWVNKSLRFNKVETKAAPPPSRVIMSAIELNSMLADDVDGEDEVFVISIQKVLEPDSRVSKLVKEYSSVFPDALPLELPPDRGSAFRIVLRPGTRPKVRPMKRYSHTDMESLKKEIESLLNAGLIKTSESEFGAQILFVNKKDGTRRMVIDYRSLNEDTVRDVYPLPLIDQIFDRLGDARIFSKLDLRSGYHQQLLESGDTYKTAFRTPMGNFEFLVLPFGLTNAPAAFVRMIGKVFPAKQFENFMVPYLDDLLVFSKNVDDHLLHLRRVLERLKESRLFAKLSKCTFGVSEVEYLGFLVGADGIRSDPAKVEAINKMVAPKNVPELRSFLGMVVYFSRFIKGFADTTTPLNALIKKGVPFVWASEHQHAFDSLKRSLSSAPVLRPFDPRHEIVVQTDASDRAVGAVLLQRAPSGPLRPVAFLSRTLSPAEVKYSAQEKEAAAVVHAFKKWEHYLMGVGFQLETDHQSFIHLKESKTPSPRLTRWLDFLAEFHYKATYRPGATNNTADCLSRLVPMISAISGPAADGDMLEKIKAGYDKDTYFGPVYKALVLNEKVVTRYKRRLTHFYAKDGLLFFRDSPQDRTCIPDSPELKLLLMSEGHDAVTSGHLGVENTYAALSRRFFWPRMGRSVEKFVRGCSICQRTKADHGATPGLLKPLEIPARPFESLGLDLVTGLPVSNGYDAILTVVDRFSKLAHFLPTTKTVSAQGVADLFAKEIFRHHGLPMSLVSDRDPRFTSDFWKALFEKLQVKLSMSTADHPQSNGQTERANGSIVQMLRAYSFEQPDTWSTHLPLLEFAFNSARNASSGVSPFAAVYGFQPTAPADIYSAGPTPQDTPLLLRLATVQKFIRENLQAAQDAQATRANESRRDVVYKVGDRVLLRSDQARSSTSVSDSVKLRDVYTGPFAVTGIGDNYVELDLPPHMKIHNRINITKVKPFVPPVVENEEPEAEEDGSYEVERILKKRTRGRGNKRRTQYLVRWKGYSADYDLWIDEDELKDAPEIVAEFKAKAK